MFLNFKFSIFESYKTSLQVNYRNILFYVTWYAILTCIGFVTLFGLGAYLDILDTAAIQQNYMLLINFFKNEIYHFFIGLKYSDVKITEFSFYAFLKLLIPEDILNQTIQTMSLKEYFNIIVWPKKIVLLPLLILSTSFIMAVSIGYIKTALDFQSGKKATLHDMYRYMYLLPQYLFAKIILFPVYSILIFCSVVIGFFIALSVAPALPFGQNPQENFGLVGIISLIVWVLIMMLLISIYQRLRFVKYFIIDQEVSALKAIRLSWNIAKGSAISLSIFSLVAMLVGIIHPVSGIFMFVSSLLNQQAEVSLYRQMKERV